MTIYSPMPCNAKLSARKYRRHLRKSQQGPLQARITRSFSEQWKRYRNSRKIVDLRLGNKTNTHIFRDGHDPSFNVKSSLHLPLKG
jgi:hypothetical protein